MAIKISGEDERRHWESASSAWSRWADAMAGLADKINQPLLDAAAVTPGAATLDLAGGTGEPAFSAARRVGDAGLSVCTDISPGMLKGAAARPAPAAGRLAFAAADMTALPFADACFDATTCRFGVMFVPDPMQAIHETARVLKPGGRAAFMLWGPQADNRLLDEIAAALDETLGPAPPNDALTGLFRFAEPDSFAQLMRDAGFVDVQEQEVRPARRARLSERFWTAPLEMSFSHRLEKLSPIDRAAAAAAVERRFTAAADADGGIILPLHARIVAGQKLPQ